MLKRVLAVTFALLFGAAGLVGFSSVAIADSGHVTTTNTGLKYEDLKDGDGIIATADREVAVHYTGWLEDGTKFDSSLDRGKPFIFTLGAGRVIKGWDEGVEGMKVGGVRRLTVPSHLGYGAKGTGGAIPPNATLIFEVMLLGVR